MKSKISEIYHYIYLVLSILCLPFIHSSITSAQINLNDHKIYFISDIQAPMLAEKLVSKYYRNEEARDSLFKDIIRQKPKNLFLLGDLTSLGSDEKAWAPLDKIGRAHV
jgi:hypothetical protein